MLSVITVSAFSACAHGAYDQHHVDRLGWCRACAEGHDTKDGDIARLSQLGARHINFLGGYLFTVKASAAGQGLPPAAGPGRRRGRRRRGEMGDAPDLSGRSFS